MNLRTLKKLSKRAAPLLPLIDDNRQQFPAERWDNYLHTLIGDRKHWERSSCHASAEPWNHYSTSRGQPIKHATRAGRFVMIRPPSHPRKGTIMVGAVSGYYEPEWDEETAYEALCRAIEGHFTDYREDEDGEISPFLTRPLNTPSEIFRAAEEMARDVAAARLERERALAELRADLAARAAREVAA